jgi:hypothetical protein
VRSCYHIAQPPTWVPPLVSCPRLLVHCIRSYPPKVGTECLLREHQPSTSTSTSAINIQLCRLQFVIKLNPQLSDVVKLPVRIRIAPLAKNWKVLRTLSQEGIASCWMAEESRYVRAIHTKWTVKGGANLVWDWWGGSWGVIITVISSFVLSYFILF